MASPEQYRQKIQEHIGKGLEVGGIIAGFIGLLSQAEYWVVSGVAAFFGGYYLRNTSQKQ